MSNPPGEVIFTPPVVTDLVARLREAISYDTRIDRIDARTWRVTTESDRVRMTVDFASGGNGKVKRRSSTLAVDGARRALAKDLDELVKIFENPGGEDHESEGQEEAAPAVPKKMSPPRSVDDASIVVRSAYQSMVKAGIDVQLGESEGNWMIGVDHPARSLRIGYKRYGKHWGISFIQVIVDGVDRSREANGDINKAITLLSGTNPAGTTEKTPHIAAPSASARSNSVETRRASVIRT